MPQIANSFSTSTAFVHRSRTMMFVQLNDYLVFVVQRVCLEYGRVQTLLLSTNSSMGYGRSSIISTNCIYHPDFPLYGKPAMHTHWMACIADHKSGLLMHPQRIQYILYLPDPLQTVCRGTNASTL